VPLVIVTMFKPTLKQHVRLFAHRLGCCRKEIARGHQPSHATRFTLATIPAIDWSQLEEGEAAGEDPLDKVAVTIVLTVVLVSTTQCLSKQPTSVLFWFAASGAVSP
jgi:hypothetical protein